MGDPPARLDDVADNVYFGPGAKLIGTIKVGNNVAIGENCVVTKYAPLTAVLLCVPGRVISSNGATDYIEHVDYEHIIA